MPKLEYFLICESVSVDQDTNRLSLFNVLEDLQLSTGKEAEPSKGPFFLNQFVAVALFNREDTDEDKEFSVSLSFNDTSGNQRPHELKFRMEKYRQRILMRFLGMPPVSNDGVLRFELNLDGQVCATHTINVHGVVSRESTDETLTE